MAPLRRLIDVNPVDSNSVLLLDCAISGVIIDAFFRIIKRRNRYYKHIPQVWAFGTVFWRHSIEGGFEKVKDTIGRDTLLETDILFIPVNIVKDGSTDHWCLIVVRPKLCQIFAYDSLESERGPELISILEFLQQYYTAANVLFEKACWQLVDAYKFSPKQTDEVSSGVFVCVFADIISTNRIPQNEAITSLCSRKFISQIIRRGRFDSEDFSLLESLEDALGFRYPGIPFDRTTLNKLHFPDSNFQKELTLINKKICSNLLEDGNEYE